MNNSTQLGGLESIDLEALHAELAQVGAMHNDVLRREAIAKIQAVALLDIAGSLRVLAAEASLAMLGSGVFGDPEDLAIDEAAATAHERDFLVVGDRVRLGDELGTTGTVVNLTSSEGVGVADVKLDDPANGPEVMRYFREHLERIVEPESSVDDDEDDDESDGFTPPATALDALREAEKSGKKKGKKS